MSERLWDSIARPYRGFSKRVAVYWDAQNHLAKTIVGNLELEHGKLIKILEIGGGSLNASSQLVRHLAESGHQGEVNITSVERSPRMRGEAKTNFQRLQEQHRKLTLRQIPADVTQEGWCGELKGTYDVVLASWVLGYIPMHRKIVFSRMKELANEGGLVVFSDLIKFEGIKRGDILRPFGQEQAAQTHGIGKIRLIISLIQIKRFGEKTENLPIPTTQVIADSLGQAGMNDGLCDFSHLLGTSAIGIARKESRESVDIFPREIARTVKDNSADHSHYDAITPKEFITTARSRGFPG